MIRQTENHNVDEQHEAIWLDFPLSCITWTISGAPPGGFAVWPAHAEEDRPLFATLSLLVYGQVPRRSVVEFNTVDALEFERVALRCSDELQLLEDARSYLDSLVRGAEPGPCHHTAWNRFFFVYTRRIQREAQQRGLSAAHTEDCVQEVWLVILEVLRKSGHEPPWDRFSCWMQGLIQNQVVNYVRRMTRRLALETGLLEEATAEDRFDPAASFDRNEQRHMVRHVLGHLAEQVSATNYHLIHLRWIEGCEVPEVAARLDLTSEQVRYRHFRVKKRLRRLLECHGAGPE
jgi:RNA polymerase sigma factor (sigma-70 family)